MSILTNIKPDFTFISSNFKIYTKLLRKDIGADAFKFPRDSL